MATATIRRSLVRGVASVLLTVLAASSTVAREPVELHVIGGDGDPREVEAEGSPGR